MSPRLSCLFNDVALSVSRMGGIPSRNARGERLLLYIGVIDVLQSYRSVPVLRPPTLPPLLCDPGSVCPFSVSLQVYEEAGALLEGAGPRWGELSLAIVSLVTWL